MPLRKKFHLIRIWPNNEGIEQAFCLIMQILKRPYLGHYVHEIRYHGRPNRTGLWQNEVNGQDPRDLTDSELNLLEQGIERAGFTGAERENVLSMAVQKTTSDGLGHRHYYNGLNISLPGIYTAQALAVILIPMAPNLASMAMTQPYSPLSEDPEIFPLKAFLLRANSNPDNLPYLRNLRKVYVMVDQSGDFRCRDDERFYVHIDFLDCFRFFDRLPSITTVSVDALTDDEEHEPTVQPSQSNLAELCITRSNISTPYMALAILSCKVLKRFQYSIGGRIERGEKSLNKKTLAKALLVHKESLEILDVDVHIPHFALPWDEDDNLEEDFLDTHKDTAGQFEEMDENDTYYDFLASIWDNSGTFKEFVALRHLSLGIDLLFYLVKSDSQMSSKMTNTRLVNGLPDNLESLCIRGHQRGRFPTWDKEIDALVAVFNSGSTNLKEIRGVDETIIPSAHVYDEEWDVFWTLDHIGYGVD
ncbi:hypothetical protein N7456_011175 [Penicillium angulare]|uniref:Uncharacterized protein n=1 Tax=Penicillium angulare TaxID=116970 RepID=A0A9W9ETG3_9EURO|nr:hypothetical protein N7456_011175 [Penicillium angulare]